MFSGDDNHTTKIMPLLGVYSMQKKSYVYSSKYEETILKFRKVKVSLSKHFIPGDTHSRSGHAACLDVESSTSIGFLWRMEDFPTKNLPS